MGTLDRHHDQPGEQTSFKSDSIGSKEGVLRFASPTADARRYAAGLQLVYQTAEVIKGIENQAIEAEKVLCQKLQIAQMRIEELEADKRTAELWINDARTRLTESDEAARSERMRLEAAERRMCELEMRARTAEAQAKENANAVARIEDGIRTQLLAKRLPANKLALST
jgi:hypothetical protein